MKSDGGFYGIYTEKTLGSYDQTNFLILANVVTVAMVCALNYGNHDSVEVDMCWTMHFETSILLIRL
jgi:hypothetical protein